MARSWPMVVEARARAPHAPARASAFATKRSSGPQSAVMLPVWPGARAPAGRSATVAVPHCSTALASRLAARNAAVGDDRIVGLDADPAVADTLDAGHDRGMVGFDATPVVDLDDDRRRHTEDLEGAGGRGTDRALGTGPDQVRRDTRVDGRRRRATDRSLDHDPLGPRQPVGDLLGERVVARHEPDGDAPRTEDQRVQAVFAGRPSGETRLDRCPGVGVGDGPARVARPGVIADEQRDVEAFLRALDHRPRLLALQDACGGVHPVGQQVVHPAMAVVDEDIGRTGRKRTLDRGVRLADHQLDGSRITFVARERRVRMVDARRCPPCPR